MAKKVKAPSPKREFRNQITEQLKTGLTGLEEKVGKKEFETRIKKAAKLLTAGIKLKPAKTAKVKKLAKEAEPVAEKAQ